VTLETRVLLGLAFASLVVFFATPVAIKVAGRLDFFDKPVGYKGHALPTPYLGGAAVVTGFVVAMLAAAGEPGRTLPLVTGVAVLWAVGTLDDRRHVSPQLRVLVELALAGGLWALNLGWNLQLGWVVDLIVTGVWVVAVVNAFNLFDNMDGASSSMVLAVSVAVAFMGFLRSDAWLAASGAALAGACAGFLPFNLARPSARIFLGDGGSMPLGFAVAALVMTGASDALPAWQALVAGLVLVGIPVLDTVLVVVSRTRKGISILTGGRDHITHRTGRRLRNARAVAAALGGAQVVVSILVLLAVNEGSVALVGTVLLYLVAAGTAITLFETQEDRGPIQATQEPNRSSAASGVAARSEPDARLPLGNIALAVLGLGAGVSAFFFAFYDSSLWLPIGLGLVTLLGVGVIARPPRLGVPAVLALGGLTALAVWAVASASWAESVQQAVNEGNRLLVLAAVLALALVLLRSHRRALVLVGALGIGIGVVAGYVVVRMLSGTPGDLFLSGRLNEPLGYINAEATVFGMGCWICFAAVERRHALAAGAGAFGATLLACLVFLSQSRGAALAMLAAVVVTVLILPGRTRRVYALAVVGAAFALAAPSLLGVYDAGAALPGAVAQDAARAALLSAALAGALWAALTWGHARIATNPAQTRRLGRLGQGALAVAAVVALVIALTSATRISDGVRTQYNAFVKLSEPAGSVVPAQSSSRLVSGAGNRYDYWRVAWNAFERDPVLGLGAGGYDRAYFAERTTSEDVRQPHSLELQTLAETGLVGGALLVLFVVGLALGALRAGRAARESEHARAVSVAALGGVTVWLAHTSVDWMHLLPGVSAIALCLGAILVSEGAAVSVVAAAPQDGGDRRSLGRPAALAAVAALVIVLAGASLSRQELSQVFEQRARAALADDPARALREAERSLRLDGTSIEGHYIKAAALARFNRANEAERELLRAAANEPSDFVTWTLLGDLSVRRANLARAAAYYARGARLNPRDAGLSALARHPGAGP